MPLAGVLGETFELGKGTLDGPLMVRPAPMRRRMSVLGVSGSWLSTTRPVCSTAGVWYTPRAKPRFAIAPAVGDEVAVEALGVLG